MSKSSTDRSSAASPRQPLALLADLAAIAEHLASWPYLTAARAAEVLGLDLASLPVDLLDLPGALACEAIEAELLVLAAGWASAREAA